MKKALILLFLSYLISDSYAIRNGELIEAHYMARLYLTGRTCSAVRVSKDYFLTAAHCIKSNLSDSFTLHYNDYNTRTEESLLRSEEVKNNDVIINNTGYSEELTLIKIESNNTSPDIVQLNHMQNTPTELSVLGYGFNREDDKVLRIGHVIYHGQDQSLRKSMIITRPGNTSNNPCPGDSGGGLFIPGTKKLIGITSYVENSEIDLYKKAKKLARRSYSFNSSEYFCHQANRAFFISIEENRDFLKTYLNL